MSTAFDLGISEQEALDAVNLEKLYGLVKKTRFCSKCSNQPTHADCNSLQLLCGAHAAGRSCKRIGEDRFTLFEIQKLQRRFNDVSPPLRNNSRQRAKSTTRQNNNEKSNRHSSRRVKSSRRRRRLSSTSEESDGSWGEDEDESKQGFNERSKFTPRSKQYNKSSEEAKFAFGFEDTFNNSHPATPSVTSSSYPPGMAGILMHKQQRQQQQQFPNNNNNNFLSQNNPEFPVNNSFPYHLNNLGGAMSSQALVNPSYNMFSQGHIVATPPSSSSYYATNHCQQQKPYQFPHEPPPQQIVQSQHQEHYLNRHQPMQQQQQQHRTGQKPTWPNFPFSSGPQALNNNSLLSKPQRTNPFASAPGISETTEQIAHHNNRATSLPMRASAEFRSSADPFPLYTSPGYGTYLFEPKKDILGQFGRPTGDYATTYSLQQQLQHQQLQQQQLHLQQQQQLHLQQQQQQQRQLQQQLQQQQQIGFFSANAAQNNPSWQPFNSYPLYGSNTSNLTPKIPRVTAVQKDWWD